MANSENQQQRLITPGLLASLVLAGVVLLLAFWIRAGLVGGDSWPIAWLDVEGQLERTSADQVRSVVSAHAERGFFAVDLDSVRASVENLPWVDSVVVRRRWPDAIVVRIREHQPLLRWNQDELISRQGEIFTVDGVGEMQGLPRLEGPDLLRQEVFDKWLAMREQLAPVGLDIERLTLDSRGAWKAELNNGTRLRLGRHDLDTRMARFVAVADELRSQNERAPRVVDLRYTNGLAVQWPQAVREETEEHG